MRQIWFDLFFAAAVGAGWLWFRRFVVSSCNRFLRRAALQ